MNGVLQPKIGKGNMEDFEAQDEQFQPEPQTEDGYSAYREVNRAAWNEWAGIHVGSKFYDVEGFKAGRTSLNSFEMVEVGEVSGKSLLHLQCHFGMDTLSWARLGARVTGVDFSDRAIETAQSLAKELDLEAEFVCSDIYELPEVLSGQFDIVYTSSGVLAWLPDLRRWGQVIAHFLRPGGFFYIAEFHPFAQVFDDSKQATDLKLGYPYFHADEPTLFKVEGTYAEAEARGVQEWVYEWTHTLGEIVTALAGAGLRIEFLHEFPFSGYAMLPPFMEQGSDGLFRLKERESALPLMFSIRATK